MKTRRQAIEDGDKFYQTGQLCKKGHNSPRYVSTRTCVDCQREINQRRIESGENKRWVKKYREKNPEKCKEMVKDWYSRNRDTKRIILYRAKTRAKKYSLDFNLGCEDIEIPEVCPALGIKIEWGQKGWSDNAPSLDRIDNTKGYIKGNVVVVSNRANLLKKDASVQELINLAKFYEQMEQKS